MKGAYLYFSLDTLEVRWATLDIPCDYILGMEKGMKERKFTDSDYLNVARSCTNFGSNDLKISTVSEIVEIINNIRK